MVLEVIEQNPRAYAFYKREGFRDLGRLSGWRLTSAENAAGPPSELVDLTILQAMKSPATCEYPERRYRDTVVVMIDPDLPGPTRIHSLFSATDDWGEQRDALAAATRKFPTREFFAAPVFPEDFGVAVFAPLGFGREKLSQFLMRRDF